MQAQAFDLEGVARISQGMEFATTKAGGPQPHATHPCLSLWTSQEIELAPEKRSQLSLSPARTGAARCNWIYLYPKLTRVPLASSAATHAPVHPRYAQLQLRSGVRQHRLQSPLTARS